MSRKNEIIKLCICSVMAALYVGLDFLADISSKLFGGTIKISLSGLPIIIVAIMFGPLWGAATGFVGAFLGQMITYGFSATTLLWVMPATFRGIIMGLLFLAFKKSFKTTFLIFEITVSSLVVTAINTVVMYLDAKIYKYPIELFGIALVYRIIIAVITAVVFALIVPYIVKSIKKVILK